MVAKRSQRMAVVLRLAVQAEEGAARQLQQSREQLQQARQQLQQMSQYQQEYIDSINTARQGVTAQSMINDRQFLAQLGQVLVSQQHQLQQYQAGEERCLEGWQQCYRRRRNLEQLIERLQQREDSHLEKQLQKELDELSAQMRQNRN